jgi:hypothetical protein
VLSHPKFKYGVMCNKGKSVFKNVNAKGKRVIYIIIF